MNAKGTTVVTADGGPNRYSRTVVSPAKDGWHSEHLVAPRGKEEDDDDESGFEGEAAMQKLTTYIRTGDH